MLAMEDNQGDSAAWERATARPTPESSEFLYVIGAHLVPTNIPQDETKEPQRGILQSKSLQGRQLNLVRYLPRLGSPVNSWNPRAGENPSSPQKTDPPTSVNPRS